MQTAIQVVGLLGVAGTVIAMLIAATGYAIDRWEKLIDRVSWDAYGIGRRNAGKEIINASWWFTEDMPAAIAVEEVGKRLMTDGTVSIGDTRESWRKRVQKLRMNDVNPV